MRKYRNIKGNLQPKRILKYSEEWIQYRKKRGADSLKVDHCDTDADGFEDSIVRDWRSPALKKLQACTPPVPELPQLGPTGLLSELLIPASGPESLSGTIIIPPVPASGPQNLSSEIEVPHAGPSGLTALALAPPTGGPSNLSSTIIIPSTLTLTPWQNNTGAGGPILGMPSANRSQMSGTETLTVQAAPSFTYTQSWGLGGGVAPQYQATFQRWSTNLPGLNNSTSFHISSSGPWANGAAYTAQPIYTQVQIN